MGAEQRSTETTTGALLMGVRLYNPETGRFLSTDPVFGGSRNAYESAGANPVNHLDLDGRWYKRTSSASRSATPENWSTRRPDWPSTRRARTLKPWPSRPRRVSTARRTPPRRSSCTGWRCAVTCCSPGSATANWSPRRPPN
ncbi:RHS repeat-associated core domain-containing protein [Streptomyces sp. NPDC054940]